MIPPSHYLLPTNNNPRQLQFTQMELHLVDARGLDSHPENVLLLGDVALLGDAVEGVEKA